MRWLISSSISPFCWMIEPRYLNFSTFGITIPSMVTSPPASSLPLKQQCRYSVLDLLTQKPLDSSVSLHRSNLSLTPCLDSSTRTMSFTNNIHHGSSSWIPIVSSSITRIKRKWLRAESWCSPIPTRKSLVVPPGVTLMVINGIWIFDIFEMNNNGLMPRGV